MTQPTGDTIGSAGSDVCEPANQNRLGIWMRGTLKRQELKQSVSGEEGRDTELQRWTVQEK